MWQWLSGYDQKLKEQPTLHKALYELLENAISNGLLHAGDKLPPHRKLASKLGIAVATVTKVYRQAERQGLINAKVGRGSFVTSVPVLPQAIRAKGYQHINLSIIKPQVSITEPYLSNHLAELSHQTGLADLMDYPPEGGSLTDQQTAIEWLSHAGVVIENKAISICHGAQHGLMLLYNAVTQYGDCIAVENHCYPGIISLANQLSRQLIGIEMDQEGMVPEALEIACQHHKIKMLIVVASHQNPTTSIMSKQRRKNIAEIVKKYDIWLVDDDVYGFLSPHLPPISNYAPQQSFYLTSLSKSILPGLRVGYLVSPPSFKRRIEAEIRNSIWMPSSLTLALTTKLIYSGDAIKIQKAQSELAEQRQKMAYRILQNCEFSAHKNSYHLWLKLPNGWSSEQFSEKLKQYGVLVASADYFCVKELISLAAIRVSLMAAKSNEELDYALKRIAKLYTQKR